MQEHFIKSTIFFQHLLSSDFQRITSQVFGKICHKLVKKKSHFDLIIFFLWTVSYFHRCVVVAGTPTTLSTAQND